MARYIDADEVKKAIEESWDGCLGAYDSHEITMNDLWVIDKVPTANVVDKELYDRLLENGLIISEALSKYQNADVVEVVRCKHCIHCDWFDDEKIVHWCDVWDGALEDDGFCHYGERGENG